jgi:UDPglucose 6-dehydrogenase
VTVAVLGLWHLGSVTAACLAAAGHEVRAFDPDNAVVDALRSGRPPVAEPGLPDLIGQGLRSGALRFTSDAAEAMRGAEAVWVTFDTPVDAEDRADVASVVRHIEAAFPYVADRALMMISSQLPVGTLRRLEGAWRTSAGGRHVSFACSPENLRLGDAINVFMNPDRVIVGVRDDAARQQAARLLAPITDRIEWMSTESAEMTKHAINAFLGTSVTFINELAAICEQVGADAKEVERGLRTESRIGPRAYLSPGGAFAGGTLARDISFLRDLGVAHGVPTRLLDGVFESNTAHQHWARRRLQSELGHLKGVRVAVWGLAYKPGTDTLRGSEALDLCRWLAGQGADVHVHDPAIATLPEDLDDVTCHTDPVDAATGARVLIVATAWPVYRQVDLDRLAAAAPGVLVLDANRFLGPVLDGDSRFRAVAVGRPSR